MIIESIEIENACGLPGSRSVVLPECGLVLVEGQNGTGKTSLLVDGPAVACWDETTRPARGADSRRTVPAWRQDGQDGHVELRARFAPGADPITIKRARSKGRTLVQWTGSPTFDTASKAQPSLDRLVGPFLAWRRSCCFSNSDAIRLSIASMTDGQLKRLIEQLLGCDFEAAAKLCAADLKTAERQASRQEAALAAAVTEARIRAEHAEAAAAARDGGHETELLADQTPALERRITATRELLEEERATQQAALRRVLEVQHQAEDAAARVRLLESGACPTCARPFPRGEVRPLLIELSRDLAGFKHEAARREAARAASATEIAELDQQLQQLTRSAAKARELLAASRAQQQAAATADARLAEARAALTAARQALVEAESQKKVAATAVSTLAAVATVLGLKGPRAGIVASALCTVEEAANDWLARLALGNMRIALQSGDMEVEGAGLGYGYPAASDGEKRRIDLALWRGIAELSPRHRGSTLLLDEPLDGLDQPGREAAASALERLSADRCVVLITHDEQLARAVEGRSAKREVMPPRATKGA